MTKKLTAALIVCCLANVTPGLAQVETATPLNCGTLLNSYKAKMADVVIGQEKMIDALLISLMNGEHILLEGPPGVAKTTTAKALARLTGLEFARIQFNSDTLPSDILGRVVYDSENGVQFHRGPIFTNILLVDEINRASPRVQSALLEAMEEKQVTIDGVTHPLPQPFIVIATQNPLGQAGTFQLPEAQMDRFLSRVVLDFPSFDEERAILQLRRNRMNLNPPIEKATAAVTAFTWELANEMMAGVELAPQAEDFLLHLVFLTRNPGVDANIARHLRQGVGPRASIGLEMAARAYAALRGSSVAEIDDVAYVARLVLPHRLILSDDALIETTAAEIVERLIQIAKRGQ